MNICEITMGMTPQEKETYFKHHEMRTKEEQEKVEAEKEQLKSYKNMLINDIMEIASDRFTYDELKKKSVRALERIYDYA